MSHTMLYATIAKGKNSGKVRPININFTFLDGLTESYSRRYGTVYFVNSFQGLTLLERFFPTKFRAL
jgi:hypothetical protein